MQCNGPEIVPPNILINVRIQADMNIIVTFPRKIY